MRINNKILLLPIIVVLSIIFMVSENPMVSAIAFFAEIMIILLLRLNDYILRRKLVNKIERENVEYVKAKENNKFMIVTILISMIAICIPIKSRYEVLKIQNNYSSINILTYMNSFDASEKVILSTVIMSIIFLIITMIQVISNPCIVSKDKVIFYDGTIFDINKIEEIEYEDSFIRKNKKVIKLSKGFIDRKIITDIENFDKVKKLLEVKS